MPRGSAASGRRQTGSYFRKRHAMIFAPDSTFSCTEQHRTIHSRKGHDHANGLFSRAARVQQIPYVGLGQGHHAKGKPCSFLSVERLLGTYDSMDDHQPDAISVPTAPLIQLSHLQPIHPLPFPPPHGQIHPSHFSLSLCS